MDFGGFDDDFFEEQDSKKDKLLQCQEEWVPHLSEPEWFYSASKDAICQNDKSFHVKLHCCNHLYFTGRYAEAATAFSELAPQAAIDVHRRDVFEGLVRSLMKASDIEGAIQATTQLEPSCKNVTQLAAYHALCAEVFRQAQQHDQEIAHLQKAIMTHRQNADLWLRLAECYASLANINIYTPFKLSNQRDTTWEAAASLLRADILLKSALGREATGILRRKRNDKLRNLIQPVIASLPALFVSTASEALCRDVYNLEPQQDAEEEFVDLGSSARAKVKESEEETQLHSADFENQWFRFADSVKDLYYISDNTHQCDS